jgi:exopolysaccharide biosynthesis operon protein EpsL
MSGAHTGRVRPGAAHAARPRRPWYAWGLVCMLVPAALPLRAQQAPGVAPAAAPAVATESAPGVARITPFVDDTETYDDNVFRISNLVNPLTTTGYPSRGDSYNVISGGVSADVPVSLQRFDATVAFNSSHYDRFHELDFNGYDLRGSWLWAVGRNLSGEIGVTDTYSLASFAELLSVVPDRLKVREAFAKGSWLIGPEWKLYADADQLVQTNSDPAVQYNNVTVDSLETSLSHVIGTANWVGLDARYESGHFPNGEPEGSALIDNGYDQWSGGLVIDWGADTPSHLVARADQVSRRYDELSQRDFDLTTAYIEYTWTPPGRVSLTAIAEREISPYEFVHSSIVLVKGIILRPILHLTPKIDLSADLEAVTRSYLSDPGLVLGLEIPRVDQVHTATALLTYRPIDKLLLQLSATHEERTSNILYGGYLDNVYWLKVRLTL